MVNFPQIKSCSQYKILKIKIKYRRNIRIKKKKSYICIYATFVCVCIYTYLKKLQNYYIKQYALNIFKRIIKKKKMQGRK